MKLYYIKEAPPAQRWQGTQVDAKATAKAAGGTFELREVPVDKTGLLAFLNDQEAALAGNVEAAHEQPPLVFRDDLPNDHPAWQKPQLAGTNRQLDELEQAELRAAAAVRTTMPEYSSPLSARDTIAGIDAGMCASAVRQMEGANLATIVKAAIERMAQLAGRIPAETTND